MKVSQLSGKQAWFAKAKFGMFVHFGLYSYVGENENKVLKTTPKAEYAKLMNKFNPVKFNANEWVKLAIDAGCRYMVVTSKHEEGFCLYDSRNTRFKSTNTPFKRDIIAELANACAKHNFKFGLYHNANTWLDEVEEGVVLDETTYPDFWKDNVKQLVTEYGPIHEIWFDHSDSKLPAKHVKEIITFIHEKQPQCMVNDRAIDLKNTFPPIGDFITPERHYPNVSEDHWVFETCDSIYDNSWGFHSDPIYASSPELLRRLLKTSAAGGNYLLNLSPDPNGTFDERQVARMKAVGAWLTKYGEAVYDTEESRLRVVTYDILAANPDVDCYRIQQCVD